MSILANTYPAIPESVTASVPAAEARAITTPPLYYEHIRQKLDARNEENKVAKREDCWERVDGWCAPYCDDMYPGPDKGAKRQACAICIAVQSAFCLA
jgi:hypothetical protein